MKKILHLLLLLLTSVLSAAQGNPPNALPDLPFEATRYSRLITNKEIVDFLSVCAEFNRQIKLETFNLEGNYQVPLLIISKNDPYFEKTLVMLMAQQHGNEPAGMQGWLMLVRDLAQRRHEQMLDSLTLIILPQCNPWGGDRSVRRNADGIDLNRDHLLMQSQEARIIQSIFEKYRPHMTVDFHEYNPFGRTWTEFGFRRNFDIQLGGPTNLNNDSAFSDLFYSKALPFVQQALSSKGYSFFEYTLGDFSRGERLRRSTVDIDDGRQSFGIAGTFSMIVEGMNGRDSLERLERRTKSQFDTAMALLSLAYKNAGLIRNTAEQARNTLLTGSESASLRQEHIKGSKPLQFPLLSLKTGRDTIFVVEEYHSKVRSLLVVQAPQGYLIPKADTLLANWLKRSNIFHTSPYPAQARLFRYRILHTEKRIEEETSNYYLEVEKVPAYDIAASDYYYVNSSQIYRFRIINALEPQAMHGLVNYPNFLHLSSGEYFPVLRVEK